MTAVTFDPARVAEYTFQHDHWDVSREIIRAVFRPGARVAVKACHASSKTFTLADCTLLALILGGDVLTTAPTWDQVEQVLWPQIRRSIQDSRVPASEWGTVNLTDIKLATGEKAIGLSTNEGVRFQGWHARPGSFLLVIVDEALGVRPDIFAAIEGIAAGGDVRMALAGNPTAPGGYFFDIFDRQIPTWQRFTIDGFDTPNMRGISLEQLLEMPEHELDRNERPYLITRRYIRDKYHEWGVDHPEWQSRVRGQFPQNADVSLIWRSWLEQAKLREAVYDPPAGPLVAGVDVAGPGEDETVLCVRQAGRVLRLVAYSGADTRGAVLDGLRACLHQGLAQVNVDTAGIGYYFAQHLRDNLPPSVTVHEINVGENPTSDAAKEKYLNLRAELYWALRQRFQDGDIAGVTDPVLITQLASIWYRHNDRGQVVIEKKEDARTKRGIKSPDRAEALMLAFAPESQSSQLARAFSAATTTRAQAGLPVDPFILATRDRRGRAR